ncbi:MAG: ankyrin repeat domain-containing protein [Alphaproteobacteria bacterium]|nr:ankyrin repeat domain-containing protein [Alphaproteobacteria bacterium]
MKKAVFLASLSVIYSNLLGMQNNMPQDDNIQKNNKKHVRFGKDSIILIDSDRLTEKHVTILQSRRSIIERFIQEVCSGKKDINSQNEDKDSALTLACNYCFYNKAHSLIDLGIDVNLTNSDGHTALMYVAMNGEISLLEKILERGAVVTKQDNKGNTPLLCAMKSPTIQDEGIRLKIVKTLINKDLNTIDQINSQGKTALSIAKNKGLTEIEELLRTTIEIKDDFWNTFEREDKEKILQLIRNNPNLCKAKNERGESPLIVATWKNYKDIIEILLQNHTDVNGTTEDGVTSLMYAAYQCNKPLVDLLLRYHADVMLQDKSGNSALHWAMNFNNLDEHKRLRVVQTLVQSNPNIINLKNLYGETALTLSESGHFKLILDFLNKYVVKSEFAEGITEKEENSKPLKEFSPYIYDPKFRWGGDIEKENFEEDTFEENKTEEKLPKDNVEQSLLDLSEKEQREIINKDITNKLYQDNFALLQQNEYLLERNAFLEWQLRNLVAKTRYEYNQGFYQKDVPLEIDENGFYVYNYDDIYPVEEIIQQQTYETDTHREETSKPQKDKDSREKKVPLTTGYDINGDIKPGKIILQRGQTLEDIKESIEEGGLIKEPISEKGTGEPKPNVEETASLPESAEESYEITKIVSEENQNLKEEEEMLVSEQPSENESRNTDKPEDSSEGMNASSKISATNSDNQLSCNKNDAALRTSTKINQNSSKLKKAILYNNYELIKKLLRKNKKLINIPIDEKGNTPQHLAAKKGNLRLLDLLISKEADKEKKNKAGDTPLLIAAKKIPQLYDMLVLYEADINTQDVNGDTPLLIAVKNNMPFLCKVLILYGADINIQDANGDTPLHLAAKEGNLRLLDLLISKEADKKKKNKAGDTPLLIVIKNKNSSLINALISYGADVDAQDANGDTPLHLAAKENNPWLFEKLIQKGADKEKKNKAGDTPIQIAVRNKMASKLISCRNDIDAQKELIKEPISEKGTGEPKPNVEETASSPESAEESYEITKIVSEENQNLKEEEETLVSEQPSENESRNTDKPEDSSEGMNVLSGIWEIWPSNTNSDNQLSYNKNDAALRTSTEIRQNSLDSVESLYSQQIQSRENTEPLSIEWVKQRIDEGLINDAVDESGNTLLHVAVTNNNIEIIEFLLKNNADLNIKNEVGNTALHNAVMQENLSIVSLLLEHKAKPNLGNQGGTSPLMLAANIGNLNILKTLIEHGSQVNATNHDKNNALMIAVLSKNCNLSAKYNMAVTLLTADLSIINQVNSEGETAQSIAKSRKFENINKLIMEAQNRLKQINDTKRKKQAEKRLNKINEQKKQADNTEKTELMSAKSIMEKGEEPKSKNSTIELTDNPKKEEVVTQVSEAIDRTSETSKETTKIENLSNSINDTSVENIQEKKTKTSTDLKSFWKNLKNNYKKFFDTKDSNGNSTMQRAKNKEESKIKEAILSNNDELITELLRGDKELLNTSIDEARNTPLLLALTEKCLDVIDAIMNYDDDIDFTHQNKDGKTAFILAAENKNIDTLNMIIDERRPGVNIADKDGNTPLIIMLKSDNYGIAKTTTYKLLVKYHDVDVNHKNKNGETALIVALKQNRLEIAALLLKNPNLRLDVTNEEGNTQLNLAMDVFQKTLESQYSESQDDLVQKTLNVLAELKKGDIEKANQLIIANFKDLKGNRESDLEILNSFRKALLAL